MSRIFWWVFSVKVWGIASFLVAVTLAVLLVLVASRLWTRWRLAFGASLLCFALWSMLVWLPKVVAVGRSPSIAGEHFAFVHGSATPLTALVVSVVGLVALGREGISLIVGRFRRRSGNARAPGRAG